jgi:hypothetical protein
VSPTPDHRDALRVLAATYYAGDFTRLEDVWQGLCASPDGAQSCAVAYLALWNAFVMLSGQDVAFAASRAALRGDDPSAQALVETLLPSLPASARRRLRRKAVAA